MARMNAADMISLRTQDVQDVADHLTRSRARARKAIARYRLWKLDMEQETDGLNRIYAAWEGMFLRRQLRDSWKTYAAANSEYHELRREARRHPTNWRAAA